MKQIYFIFKVMFLHKRLISGLFLVFCSFFCFSQNEEPSVQDSVELTAEQKLCKEAIKLIDSSQYKQALVPLKKAIKINPLYAEAYTKMGLAKIKTDDYKGGEKDLITSLKLEPSNFETLKLLGTLCFDQERFADCKMYFDSAANQKVDDAGFYYLRAQLMFKGKNYKGALDMAAYAIELKPKYVEVMEFKGEVRFAQKDYNYTIKELNEAIKFMDATKPVYSAYKLRAKARFEVSDFKGAVTDWNVYIDAFPKEEEALISRGAAKINANDNSSAIVDLDEALKINPKNPVIYNYRGVAKGGNKLYVEALKDFDYSIKLKFNYASAYVNRAAIKLASKDKHGACEDLKKAESLGDEMAIKLVLKYCGEKYGK